MKRYTDIPLPGRLLLVVTAVMLAICYAHQPWVGDDLVYGYAMENYPLWHYPLNCASHWLHYNGRMANFLAMLLMKCLPTWLIAILNAAMTAAFYRMILTLARPGRKSAVMSVGVIALVMFTFCWWDSFFLFDVSLNYTWAVTFGMIWAWWLVTDRISHNKILYALSLGFAAIAGCMHEAMSMPLLAGVIVWLAINSRWKGMPTRQIRLVVAFALGALIAIASPGIWARLGRGAEPDDPMPMLLLKSDWMALLMLLLAAVLMIARSTRCRLAEALKTTDLPIWIVAALGSMAFSAVGGVVGRSGWFANTFALIAVVRMLYPYFKLPRGAAGAIVAVLFAACTFHLAEFVRWQIVTGKETRDVTAMYHANPAKPIYYDYTYLDEVPWWVLNKLRLVPDPDNFHELRTMKFYLGDKTSPVIVLPTEVKSLDINKLYKTQRVDVRHGFVTLTPPPRDGRNIAVMPGGEQWMVVPFSLDNHPDSLYYVTPRQLNPGDR